jgi:hypothetical protein
MRTKRVLLLSLVVALVLMAFLLAGRKPRNPAGSLSITFVGLTNDVSGKALAEFSVASRFSRRVQFDVCEAQICQSDGWPDWLRVANGFGGLAVSAGSERVFSVPVPLADTAWRVPIIYQEDLSFADNVRFRIDLLAWGILRWRPGQSLPVRHGDGFHHTAFAYSPEMVGGSILTTRVHSIQGNTTTR